MIKVLYPILAVAFAVLLYLHLTADYTMSQEQAKAYCHATVYYGHSIQEDDLYIQPSDIGKVDLKPMPY